MYYYDTDGNVPVQGIKNEEFIEKPFDRYKLMEDHVMTLYTCIQVDSIIKVKISKNWTPFAQKTSIRYDTQYTGSVQYGNFDL